MPAQQPPQLRSVQNKQSHASRPAISLCAEGQWRPADGKCDWFDIAAEPQTVAAVLAAARAPSAAGGSSSQAAAAAAGAAVKAEPGTSGAEAAGAAPCGTAGGTAGGTANGTANGAAEELVLDSDSSEEEDEAEELRKAAAAVRRASAGAIEALAGQVGGWWAGCLLIVLRWLLGC